MDTKDKESKLLREAFYAEAPEILSSMEDSLLSMELNKDSDESLQRLFRGAHTIKGGADLLGMKSVTSFTHKLEDAMERIQECQLSISKELISLLLKAVDTIEVLIEAERKSEVIPPDRYKTLLESIQSLVFSKDSQPTPAKNNYASTESKDSPSSKETQDTLRVSKTKLDKILTLTSEIAILRGRLETLLRCGNKQSIEQALEVHEESNRYYLELQELVMKARLVPLELLFKRYARTVRDIASEQEKDVKLVIQGSDVEVDTAVIDHMRAPLTHMIRNAIDHGIETSVERKKLGKDKTAHIKIRASHEGGNIMIELSDDGRGISKEKIRAKALSQGLLNPETDLSDDGLYQFIFRHSFSTKNTVSNLSGRGIGMDVVKKSIDALQGKITVESNTHVGTKFIIRLPLTVAIIDGFVVGVGTESYVIPLDFVSECVELPVNHDDKGETVGIFNLRGKALPYIRLRKFFNLDAINKTNRESLVIVQHGSKQVGLGVDRLAGQTQAVIKSMGNTIKNVQSISGSTILGDGRVALILDVSSLMYDVAHKH